MFNDPRDINRGDIDPNFRDPAYVAPPAAEDDAGWGLPLAILAVVVVIGGLFYFGHGTDQQTAANQPRIERTAPPATPSPVAPSPVTPAPTTAPQQQ